MSKKLKSILNAGILSLLITSCSLPFNSNQSGSVNLGFKFPKSGFSIKAIPENTDYINIKIIGTGIPENAPITKRVNKSDTNTSVSIQNLATGDKKVQVQAFDNSNKLLAEASSSVVIEAGKSSQVTVELKEIQQTINDFKIKVDNFPANASVVLSELTTGSESIQKQTSVNEDINFGNVNKGNSKLRITVFSDDATPLATITKNINVENSEQTVSLENVSLPDLTDLSFNSIPTELITVLNNTLIKFKDNNIPERQDIKLYINGKEKTPSYVNTVPTCINDGDNLRIEVTATDADNDPINYFWGRTSIFGNSYKMQLQDERSRIFNKTVDFGTGGHSIGVIITDKKSYAGPFTIFFNDTATKCPE